MTIDPTGTRMFAEAASAAEAVGAQQASMDSSRRIGAGLRARPPRLVVTIGRGSSDHAATFARYLFEIRTRVPAASFAPSVASVYGATPRADGALCLAFSQSGKSPDLVAAAEAMKAGGGHVVALVNDRDSPLAAAADDVLPLDAGPERSVAATKSVIASLAMVLRLVGEWTDDDRLRRGLADLPQLLRGAFERDWPGLESALKAGGSAYVIGRGPALGIAQEAALKLKEVAQLHAEAVSAAELRHGPLALVRESFPVLPFVQGDESEPGLEAVLADLAERGATIVECPRFAVLPELEPVLQLQSFYRAVNALAVARGLDPDRPPHLNKVTRTV